MKYIKKFEIDGVQYRDYKKGDILKYIHKSDSNWYKLTRPDNVNIKGSLLGKIVDINDPLNSKIEYLYKLEPVTEVDIDAKKYNL